TSWNEMLDEGSEIREHLGARRQTAFVARFLSLSGQHQHRPRAGGRGGLRVLQRIAHHVDVLERNVEAARDLEKHARLGLAALAARIRRMRAEEESVDAPARLPRGALQRLVDLEQRAGVEEAARNAGLVGRDDDAVAGLREPRDRLDRALDRAPLLERLDVM